MKRIITVFLSLLLAMSLCITGGGEVYGAEQDPPAISDTYVVDDITYYDVKSSHIDSPIQLYEDMIAKEHSSLGGLSLAKLWMLAGAGLIDPYAGTTDLDSFKLPAIKNFLLTGNEDDYFGYRSYSYSVPEWKSNGKYVETSCSVHDSIFNGLKVTARFSDFKVVALIPGDKDHYVSSTIENSPPSEGVEVAKDTALRNDSAESPTLERSLGSSSTEGLQTSLTHTSGYSFTENVKYTNEFKAGIFGIGTKASIEVGVAFQQSFSDALTNTETKSKTYTDGTKTTLSLKPYTTVLLNVSNSDLTTTTRYNCPIGLMYKVKVIVEETGIGVGGSNFTFGGTNNNAISELNTRAFVDGQKRLDPDSIDWVERLKDSTTKDAIQKLTTHIPMSSIGATTKYLNKSTLYTVNELAPIYPLRYVALTNAADMQKSMKVGTSFYADAISLSGFNYKDGPYYKFVPYGKWIVVDENGNEITDGSGAVVLETVAASGQTKCRAVRAGTSYIKFMIDEKSYPNEIINSQTYVTNKDLSKTAVIEINVTDDGGDDKVVQFSITGNYTGIVNAAPEQIEGEGNGRLEVTAKDSTGKEIEADYEWDAMQLKGIKIEKNGMISFTKAGSFDVRVISPNRKYYSDWKKIRAEVNVNNLPGRLEDEDDEGRILGSEYADAETVIEISGSYTGGVSAEPALIDGTGKLKVRAHDSDGKEKAIIYVWETENSNGMTLTEDGTVSFTQKGLYHARVRSGEYVSEWVTLKANDYAPARFISFPTAAMNTYDGTAHALLNDDAVYEGGLRLMYGLADSAAAIPTEYSTEIPEATNAGTYYVWCKILGDSDHGNSDAVCIVSAIDSQIEPEPEPEPTPNNPGSSGGGCNSGFVFMGLILLGIISMIRKESHR